MTQFWQLQAGDRAVVPLVHPVHDVGPDGRHRVTREQDVVVVSGPTSCPERACRALVVEGVDCATGQPVTVHRLAHRPVTVVARYAEPGSGIPGQPGMVVADCGHQLAFAEWQAGSRVCERCPAPASKEN